MIHSPSRRAFKYENQYKDHEKRKHDSQRDGERVTKTSVTTVAMGAVLAHFVSKIQKKKDLWICFPKSHDFCI